MTREPSPVFDLVAGAKMQIGRSQASDRHAVQPTSTSSAAACAALLVREAVDALIIFGLDDDFTQVIQADWKLAAQKADFGGTGHGGLAVVHAGVLGARDALGNTARGNFPASAAAAYAQGLSLSMHNLFDGESHRNGIPLYPFAGRGYWLQRSTA